MLKTFEDFEFDDRRKSLRAEGRPVKLSGQPADLLYLLLERPGELIKREEIERSLWPDRNVDFDHSLDVVVNRLRTVLGDKRSNPRYIETVPRKGYRFIEPVTTRSDVPRANAPRHWARRLVACSRRDAHSDWSNSLSPHPIRQVCSFKAFANIINRRHAVMEFRETAF